MQNNKNITMELASKYSPSEVEGKWYEYWLKHKLFSSKPDNREPYTIRIPPPNVTGVLHMGGIAQRNYTGHPRAPRAHGGQERMLGAAPTTLLLPPKPRS